VACSAMRTNSCQAGPRGGPSRYHYYQVRSAPPRGLHLVPSVARPLFRACPQRRLPVDLGVEINLQSNRKKKRWSSRSEASYFRARSWTSANLNYSRPQRHIRPRGGSSRNPRVAELNKMPSTRLLQVPVGVATGPGRWLMSLVAGMSAASPTTGRQTIISSQFGLRFSRVPQCKRLVLGNSNVRGGLFLWPWTRIWPVAECTCSRFNLLACRSKPQ
jgi:hypothetical protein